MILEDFRVWALPDTVYYIPDVITPAEEALLLDRISKTPKTKWTQLRNRRLQNWGGLPHTKGMIPEQMPEWLQVCQLFIWKYLRLQLGPGRITRKGLPLAP